MPDQFIADVKFEIDQIDQLLGTYTGLLSKAEKDVPNLVEVTAIGAVLHSFYNGIENIFTLVAKNIDGDVPASSQWHRDLLNRMTQPATMRKAVLSAETAAALIDYLTFRHFFRHSYSFHLDWDELEELVTSLRNVWKQTKRELESFLSSLDAENDGAS